MLKKTELRKEYIAIRKRIPDKDIKSDIIAKKLLSLPCFDKAKNIALYNSLRDEVNTRALAHALSANGKRIYFPRVCGDDMDFYKIKTPDDANEKSSLGVYEPAANKELLISPELLDIIIIPGVCFDMNKNRIGFGKGYYDGYLSRSKNALKIAICFEEQMLKNDCIEAEGKDIKPDLIVTQEKIYK